MVAGFGNMAYEKPSIKETPTVETPPTVAVDLGPQKMYITLEGRVGGELEGSVNGSLFKLPTGVEIEVTEQVYNAVKAYIKQERI